MAKLIQDSLRPYDVDVIGGNVVQIPIDIYTKNGQPLNTFSVRNETPGVINVGKSPLVSATGGFILQVGANYSTTVFSMLNGLTDLYIYAPANGRIHIDAFYAEDLDASSLPQTVQTINVNSAGANEVILTGPIPAGSNHIGGVKVDAALPAGTNTIGGVEVRGSLPVGSNKIGSVEISDPVTVSDPPSVPTSGPQIFNVAAPVASTQYSQALTNIKKLTIYVEGGAAADVLKVAFANGAVTDGPCITLPGNGVYFVDGVNVPSMTAYFSYSAAGKMVVVEKW